MNLTPDIFRHAAHAKAEFTGWLPTQPTKPGRQARPQNLEGRGYAGYVDTLATVLGVEGLRPADLTTSG